VQAVPVEEQMPEQRSDDVKDAGSVKPRGFISGAIPGDPTEGNSPGRAGTGVRDDEETFDQEAEMERLEAQREGFQMDMGTPAGATSDALRNIEEVPVHDRNRGQSKDRANSNAQGRR